MDNRFEEWFNRYDWSDEDITREAFKITAASAWTAAVAAEREWISVEEQLPPLKSLVLVTDGHRRTLGCYKMRGGLRPAGTKDEPFWDTYRPYIIVTHWKPLPDPPEPMLSVSEEGVIE